MGRVAQSVQRLATGQMVRGLNPGGGEIFRTCPDRLWGPPSLLYNGYRVFPESKERPGYDADPHPFQCRDHERVELYLYSPYGPYGLHRASVPVQGCTLPYFTLQRAVHCISWCYMYLNLLLLITRGYKFITIYLLNLQNMLCYRMFHYKNLSTRI